MPGALGEEIRKAIDLSSSFEGYLWMKWYNGNMPMLGSLFASMLGAEQEIIRVNLWEGHDELRANPWNRCYYCKSMVFGTILEHMKKDGRTVLLDGTNASDREDRRPDRAEAVHPPLPRQEPAPSESARSFRPLAFMSKMRFTVSATWAAASTAGMPPRWMLATSVRSDSIVFALGA